MAYRLYSLFGDPGASSSGGSAPGYGGPGASPSRGNAPGHRDPGESSSGGNAPGHGHQIIALIVQWIGAIQSHETREAALLNLSKNRGLYDDLAVLLWDSFGTISTLLQEILAVYRVLSTPNLTEREANRLCNALVLFQCVAAHPETRPKFIKANIPTYLYPFLKSKNTDKPHEYLRLTSLGVIGSLVKTDDAAAVNFLLRSEVFPCLICSMEVGGELSRTVATFTINKILIQEEGMKYCVRLSSRFHKICGILKLMVDKLAEELSPKLLKLVICCYLKLSEHPRACDALKALFPAKLADNTFMRPLLDDPPAFNNLQELLRNVMGRHPPSNYRFIPAPPSRLI